MPLAIEMLEAKLKEEVGDPKLKIVLPSNQILCREADEDIVKMLTDYHAPDERYQVVGL